jgi:hypothetical protein
MVNAMHADGSLTYVGACQQPTELVHISRRECQKN